MKNKILFVSVTFLASIFLKIAVTPFLQSNYTIVKVVAGLLIIVVGAFYILKNSADVIEETTDVLHSRTKIAGGVLQSFGTAFPDMVLGIVAAISSLKLRDTNYLLAVNYAIIAAATTFGSNIYNIGHAIWCIYRQNVSNMLDKSILMFPNISNLGTLIPMRLHKVKPSIKEIETATSILVSLTVLTTIVSVSMVAFGKVSSLGTEVSGDLYQLIRPVGFFILIISLITIYLFRKSKRDELHTAEMANEERYFKNKKSIVIWAVLIVSGISILIAAESMVHSIQILSAILNIPVVISGVAAGIIGCLGEMIVVHNFSVHPQGRIGDAIVGVAMDNIVTLLGASVVAIIGGVFLGGNALILIFVLILMLNTLLIWQIGKLKDYVLHIDKI